MGHRLLRREPHGGMHIRTLRQKLGDAGTHIQTIRSVGYRWEDNT